MAFTVLVLLLAAVRYFSEESASVESPPVNVAESGEYRVERAVDGDTLLLDGGERVRLLGVDTPETKHRDKPVDPLGLEAAEFVADKVNGRVVRLEFDRERRDHYDRLLAYVYLDGELLNEELILAGYSRAITHHPYRSDMKRRFRQAEESARQRKVGLFAEPAVTRERGGH